MTRDQQLKWCENCSNRFSSKDGLLCSLTMKMADFSVACPDFNIELKEALINDKRDLKKRYESNKLGLKELKESRFWHLFDKRKLASLNEVNLKSVDYRFFYILYILTSLIIFSVSIYDFFMLEYRNSTPLILIFVSTIGGITFSILTLKYKKDNSIYLRLWKEGINFDGKTYLWNEVNLFQHYSRNGKCYLIIKEPFNKEVKILLDKIELLPSRIFNMIHFMKSTNQNSNA